MKDRKEGTAGEDRWSGLLLQWLKDMRLWLFCFFFLAAFRVLFIWYFSAKIAPSSGPKDLFAVLMNGARFDAKIAAYWMLVPFICSAVLGWRGRGVIADRVRLIVAGLYAAVTTVLCGVTLSYFREFDSQFDHFFMNAFYDDPGAIFGTIVAEYHVGVNLAAFCVVAIAGMLAARRLMKWPGSDRMRAYVTASSGIAKAAALFLLLCFVIISLRGSAGRRPVQMKDAAVTQDGFLNQAVINPYTALYNAVSAHRGLSRGDGLRTFLPDGDLAKAVETFFGRPAAVRDLDLLMERTAAGPKGVPPRHVFLIVMESLDAWPLMEAYASLGLTDEVKRLAREGISVQRFLPASWGTMTSLAAIMTGLPDSGVMTNYQPLSRSAYPSSIAGMFRKLGYRTRFYYGGYLSWQGVGAFARAQGFEEIFGAPHMGSWASTNEWGVDDKTLFDFLLGRLDDQVPSFNLIMTTGYHPPYNRDIYEKGFPLRSMPAQLAATADGSVSLKTLGHLWYADRALGSFVAGAEKKLTAPVFAITGDHFSRRFIHASPTFYERSAVPLVLYGRKVLRGITLPQDAAGSHIDIGATLFELAAPKGTAYHALGRDILAPGAPAVGVGRYKVIGPGYMLDLSGRPALHALPGQPVSDNQPPAAGVKAKHDALHGIGWWRIMRGSRW